MSICTEAEARNKTCPIAPNNISHRHILCGASGCMAWRWHKQPETQAVTRILFDQYVERADQYGVADEAKDLDAANEPLRILGIRLNPKKNELAEMAWERAHTALVQAMAAHQPPLEDFPRPGGEGWTPGTPEFFEDDEEWTITWTRETDPKATGFCGACPVPPNSPALFFSLKARERGWIDPVKDDGVSLAPGKIVRGE